MNIDFAARPWFSSYVLLLMVTGIAMVVLGGGIIRSRSAFLRFFNVLVGLGFFGYGVYLAFIFQGGHYVIFFKAFVLPVVLIIRTLASARRAPKPSAPALSYGTTWGTTPPAAPAQPLPTYGLAGMSYPQGAQPGPYPPAVQPGPYPPAPYPSAGSPAPYPPAVQPGAYPPVAHPAPYPPVAHPAPYPPAAHPQSSSPGAQPGQF